ncbi:hypothetical protein ACU4GA_06350 [Methylobacterium oryzae CBMB20]
MTDPRDERAERLKAALRQNLRRRKAAGSRARRSETVTGRGSVLRA